MGQIETYFLTTNRNLNLQSLVYLFGSQKLLLGATQAPGLSEGGGASCEAGSWTASLIEIL